MISVPAQLNTPMVSGEDDVSAYLQQIRHFPMLTAQEELELANSVTVMRSFCPLQTGSSSSKMPAASASAKALCCTPCL